MGWQSAEDLGRSALLVIVDGVYGLLAKHLSSQLYYYD